VAATRKYPVELRERAVRLYRESDPKPVIAQLARQLNVHPEALRNWIRQDEADRGERHDRPTTEMVEENRRLLAENKELRQINEVLRAASLFRPLKQRQILQLISDKRKLLKILFAIKCGAPHRFCKDMLNADTFTAPVRHRISL
jgi:transposase